MTVQTFLKAAQAAGLAHNHGVGGEFILVGTGKQLEALERALVGDGGYVPGVMRCDRCKFELTRVSLNVNVGTVTAGNSEPEPCPNGCGALRPTTWKEHAQAAFDGVDALLERAEKAEKALAVRGAALGDATEQSLGLYAAQADAIRELLDKHAPWAAGNLQTRIELVLNVLKVTANSAAGVRACTRCGGRADTAWCCETEGCPEKAAAAGVDVPGEGKKG